MLRWYIAKFVPDLVREEPINVGVIAMRDSEVAARFLGVHDDGRLDGRRVVDRIPHVEGYRVWMETWAEWAASERDERTDATVLSRRPGDQFFLVEGGKRLYAAQTEAADAETALQAEADALYARIVSPQQPGARAKGPRRKTRTDIWRALTRRWSEAVVKQFRPKEITSPRNRERFEHVFTNGCDHVVHPVSLDAASELASMHQAAEWEGRIRALEPDPEKLKIDIVLGLPPLEDLKRREAAEDAADGLRRALHRDHLATVVTEADQSEYARTLADEVARYVGWDRET